MIADRTADIVIYVPRSEAVATQRCIRRLAEAGTPIYWEGPLPSPGASPKEGRVTFRGHLQEHLDPLSILVQNHFRDFGRL